MRILSVLKSAFFPKTCAGCGEIIHENEELCDYCNEMLARCNPLKRCIRCGQDKKNCECSLRVFRFDGCIAPFYNTDVAKRIVYSFKFRRKMTCGKFLTQQMALAVQNEYRAIRFDGITFVPMPSRKQRRRGFNQSAVLAAGISEIIGIPLLDTLVCTHSGTIQHDLSLKERFQNVKGLYRAAGAVRGKTLLLVDDIKTTGATLDECAGQLLKAGAQSVYCVTALMSEKKKRKMIKPIGKEKR